MTARCTANSTWGPLDMSQCTFTNGISVAAVAVVEVQSLVEDSILEMNVRDELITDKIECTEYLHAIANKQCHVSKHIPWIGYISYSCVYYMY